MESDVNLDSLAAASSISPAGASPGSGIPRSAVPSAGSRAVDPKSSSAFHVEQVHRRVCSQVCRLYVNM